MTGRFVTSALYQRLQTEVHVWFCQPPAIQDAAKLAAYKAVLSVAETEQYHRFYREQDRHSYLVSHALLRYSLSKYANVAASQWQFASGKHGKPELFASSASLDLGFNLTHTAGLSACVIALNKRCGIDAENSQRKNKLQAVAQRMFAEEELLILDAGDITPQFYYLWTLREAYVKALGSGLAGSSKAFYFDVEAKDLSVKMHQKNNESDNNNWRFQLYRPTQTHILAVAVESKKNMQFVANEWSP